MTISPPQLMPIPAQQTAKIHLTIASEAMREMIGSAIQEVFAAVQVQGLAAVGPWFIRHLRRPSETFDFKVGVTVSAAVQPVGRVAAGQLPAAAQSACTVYSGPCEGLATAVRPGPSARPDAGGQAAGDLPEQA